MTGRFLVFVLGLAVALSAIWVVGSKHHSRMLFVQIRSVEKIADELNTEWRQLELEYETWAAQAKIEKTAQQRLGMFVPPLATVRLYQ